MLVHPLRARDAFKAPRCTPSGLERKSMALHLRTIGRARRPAEPFRVGRGVPPSRYSTVTVQLTAGFLHVAVPYPTPSSTKPFTLTV